MCVSTNRAEFSGTTLYTGRRRHPQHGVIHVLGYQNTAVNLSAGANAMLLHLPGRSMSPENFLSAGGCTDILSRMVDAVRPPGQLHERTRSASTPRSVQVFDHDIYTVLLAEDATQIPAALAQVPARKRPGIDPELLRFYADHYPEHTIVLCCFDNAEAKKASPLLLWYRPLDPDVLTAPALDCHTGGVPATDTPVVADHWVVFGSDEAPAGWGTPVNYPAGMPGQLYDFLPDTVVGRHFGSEPLPNGDFALTHEDLLTGSLDRIHRLQPAR
ncbi:hypothetical protein F4556_007540 [Kitasatospora gansuensis]|uniref:Uncharacterized protein n=1 Tax=Kitasatospora gansuensis TaxID=258050 RepID=A0A7W7WLW4_9ACTN|nr:hypothetical protein [Kitasatospora gansuensis]MBB4951886.1 hypothetical protein [Kitasatospora gansuensis]